MLIHLTSGVATMHTILRDGKLRALGLYGAAYNVSALAGS